MRIGFNSVVVTVLNAAGQGASFVLFAVIATLFGATWQTDAFFLALTIPALFIGSLVNAITSVFIPVITECRIKRPEAVGALVGSALLYVLLFSLLASAGLVLLTPSLMSMTGRGIPLEGRQLAAQYTLLLAPMIATQTLIGVMAAAFNAAGRFALPASAVVVRFVSTLGFVILLKPEMGVSSLPISFVFGAVLQFLVVTTFFGQLKLRLRFTLRMDAHLARSFRLALPLILGTTALQLSVVISRFLASQLSEGSVSVLDYATRISAGIMELLTSGVLLVTLSNWSRLVTEGDPAELRAKLQQTMMMILFIILPSVAVLLALHQEVAQVLLQRGAFTAGLTAIAANVLVFSLLAIPVDAVARTYVRLFLVWQNTALLGGLALASLLSQTVLALVLIQGMDVQGLALANLAAVSITLVTLILVANRRLGNTLSGQRLALFKLFLIAIGSGIIVVWFNSSIIGMPLFLRLPFAVAVGLGVYGALAWLLRVAQFRQLLNKLNVLVMIRAPWLSAKRFGTD